MIEIEYELGEDEIVLRYDAVNINTCNGSTLSLVNAEDLSDRLEEEVFDVTIYQNDQIGYVEIVIFNDEGGD